MPLDMERQPLSGTTQMSYGLGWPISDYRGKLLLEHNGAMDGFRSRILLLPRERIGLVILVNVDDDAPVMATGFVLADRLLALPAGLARALRKGAGTVGVRAVPTSPSTATHSASSPGVMAAT